MFTITIVIKNLTEEAEKYLEKEYAKLEKIYKKPREFYYDKKEKKQLKKQWDIK